MIKKGLSILMIFALVFVLGSCGNDNGKSEENKSGQEKEERGVLSQFAEDNGTIWKESWTVETAGGDSVSVDVNADITVPKLSRMSTVEVTKYEFNQENKKKVAEAVFGEEIYYGEEEKLPGFELEKLLEQERKDQQEREEEYEDGSDKKLQKGRERIKKYEEMMRNAPNDYVKLKKDDFQGERFIGERNGIQFSLTFDEDETDLPELSEHMEISVSPLEQEDIFPEKARKKNAFVSYLPGDMIGDGEELKNECAVPREDAERQAKDFIQKMGFSDLILRETNNLVWAVSENGKRDERTLFADGWTFDFVAGTDGVAFDSFGVEGDSVYRIGEEEYPAAKKYSLNCNMHVFVTERGVIEAVYFSPVESQTVTPGVKLLSLKDIKEIVKNNMQEYAQFYIDKGKKKVGSIRFNYLELVYYRLDDPDNENRFTYIPAWRLRKNGDQQLYFIVNAMDGSVIRDWESTWRLSADWRFS